MLCGCTKQVGIQGKNQGIRRRKTVDSESLIMSMCTVVRDYLKKGNKFKFVLYLVLSHRAWSGWLSRQMRCEEKHGDVAAAARGCSVFVRVPTGDSLTLRHICKIVVVISFILFYISLENV